MLIKTPLEAQEYERLLGKMNSQRAALPSLMRVVLW